MRRLFAVKLDLTGNLPPLADVFPDQMAPIVRAADKFSGYPPGTIAHPVAWLAGTPR